mmetsp:Transcript_53100/g.104797  ORF Transcript_53100/g.104797 Transcript_53100/m.104797 type:complete len:115 (+) Transcript_53100:67-411(+)
MRHARSLLVSCVLVALGAAEEATPSEPLGPPEVDEESPEAVMSDLDSNKDGKLTIDEIINVDFIDEEDKQSEEYKKFEQKLRDQFQAADANNDNNLDMGELPALLKAFNSEPEL